MDIQEINRQIEAEKKKLQAAPGSAKSQIQARITELENQKKDIQRQIIEKYSTTATEQEAQIAAAQTQAKAPATQAQIDASNERRNATPKVVKSKSDIEREYQEALKEHRKALGLNAHFMDINTFKQTRGYEEAPMTAQESAAEYMNRASGGRVNTTADEVSQETAEALNAVTGGQVTGTNTPTTTSSGAGNGGYVSNINMETEETDAKPMEVNESNIDEWAQRVIDKANEGAKADVEKDNLIESESEDLSKLRDLYKDIPDYGIEGLPSTIMQAWRSGLLGEVGSKDAETARNQLVLNQIFNTLGNMGAAWQGKEGTQSLWDTKTAKDWEAATERKNEKFKTQMEQQLNLSNLAAEDQEKARAAIKELSTDAYFQRATQQLSNIEDTLGLFELKKSIGNEWGKMDRASKQNLLAAYQLVASGNVDAAQNAVNSMPKSEQEKVGKALLDAQIKQAVANGNLTSSQAALINKQVANYESDMFLRNGMLMMQAIGNFASVL